MAFTATLVWEFRTTGASNNGGAFDTAYAATGGVDYCQQDSPQLTVTDAVSNGTTTITSVTGGFTAAMVGNMIYLSNITGRRLITAYTNTNTITVDSTVTSATETTARVGGAIILPTDGIFESFIAGNIAYIKSGTYTIDGTAIDVAKDGTALLPMKLIGYKTTRGDNPQGDDRPLFDGATGGRTFSFDNYWHFYNIRASVNQEYGWRGDGGCVWINCKSTNSSATASRNAFYSGAGITSFINCEGISTNGYAFQLNDTSIIGCYVHDSTTGIYNNLQEASIVGNIVDTCTTGIDNVGSSSPVLMANNTIYNCTVGIQGTTATGHTIMNNIIDSCTTGITYSTGSLCNPVLYNNFYNSGAGGDIVGLEKSYGNTALDPQFTDAPNGDFRIGRTLNALAYPRKFGTTTDNYLDVGAVQRLNMRGPIALFRPGN